MPPSRALIEDEPTRGSIFLGGSIDNGSAVDWQAFAIEMLNGYARHIFNPRRPLWDINWAQDDANPIFHEQVTWELDHIALAEVVILYFAPGSLAPITLLELGLIAAATPEKLVVCCPDGFWRKGNVDMVCTRYQIAQVHSLDELLMAAKKRLARRL